MSKRRTAIQEIDKLLQPDCLNEIMETPNAREKRISDIARFVCLRFDIPLEYSAQDPAAVLLARSANRHARRLFAIALLHVLSAEPDFIRGSPVEHQVWFLFDEILSKDLYSQSGVSERSQRHEKLDALIELAHATERDLTASIDSLRSLAGIKPARTDYMRAVNAAASKALIHPFLDKTLVGSRLDMLFTSAEEFEDVIKSSPPRLIMSHRQFSSVVGEYLSDVSAFGTSFAVRFLGAMATKIQMLANDAFRTHPASRPAELAITTLEKKYPLHKAGQQMTLHVVVKNNSHGHALDTSVILDADGFEPEGEDQFVGEVSTEPRIVAFPGKVARTAEEIAALVQARWTNYDGTSGANEEFLIFPAQRQDVNWEKISKEVPYDLNPVASDVEFAGRTAILRGLAASATKSSMGSAYVHGQKRVGKTSIVRRLEEILTQDPNTRIFTIFLEAGDYVVADAELTVQRLTRRLVRHLVVSNPMFSHLEPVGPNLSLSDLTDVLDEARNIDSKFRVLIVLDEFDELPFDLYRRGPLGDSFFVALRSVSAKPFVGVILVGGERMAFIVDLQGEKLNRFRSIPVGYFDRDRQWTDFLDLVHRPVSHWLEFESQALNRLYVKTKGNPYFTKVLCASLVDIMIERRDCHVTESEIEEAEEAILSDLDVGSFAHFWSDGILRPGDEQESLAVQRKKVLLAVAGSERESGRATATDVVDRLRHLELFPDQTEQLLQEFERRDILVRHDDRISFVLPIFGTWLKEYGFRSVIADVLDRDAHVTYQEREDQAYVTSPEVIDLVNGWGHYKGLQLSPDHVRAWLRQFGGNQNQRLMFTLLQHTRLYSSSLMRSKFHEAFGVVRRSAKLFYPTDRTRKRADVIVSWLDGAGKSGAHCARLYAEENGILKDCVVEPTRLGRVLGSDSELNALVFVDDFVGTGRQASENLPSVLEPHIHAIKQLSIPIFVSVIAGFAEGISKIDKVACSLALQIHVGACDVLDSGDRCFSSSSRIFPDEAKRTDAYALAMRKGKQLIPRAPLGYGDCQALVVFEHNTPNNTLPILWAEDPSFRPLFPRSV
jgi:hypothetical protein